MGRPTKLTKERVAKLVEVLKLGMPMEKACKYADIDKTNVYRRAKKDKAFRIEIESARYFATKIARSSVIKHMMKDGNLALKYLERKEKDEFSTKHIRKHVGAIPVNFSEEGKKRMGKYKPKK